MIPVIDFVMSLRYALGDMQELNVSDYELLEPINQAASKIYSQLSQRYVHSVIKRADEINIDPEASAESIDPLQVYELPAEFVRIHQVLGKLGESPGYRVIIPSSINPPVKGTYRILGNTLYAPKGTYCVEYYYVPPRVYALEEEIDVQESMRTWVEQVALSLFKKDYATAQELTNQCELVMAGRQISHFENTGPTQVLGGRV